MQCKSRKLLCRKSQGPELGLIPLKFADKFILMRPSYSPRMFTPKCLRSAKLIACYCVSYSLPYTQEGIVQPCMCPACVALYFFFSFLLSTNNVSSHQNQQSQGYWDLSVSISIEHWCTVVTVSYTSADALLTQTIKTISGLSESSGLCTSWEKNTF